MLLIEEGKDYDNVEDASLPYTLVRNLGHGHSGNVEEVRDEVTKAVFARKTIYIPASRLSKQERTRVFHNEVRIIRALGQHRHIISVFATYVSKRHFGLILQPVASDGDLEDFLAEYWNIVSELEGPDTHNACLEAMVPMLENAFGCLASGLAFMHDRKVRHKDVKPRNILVHQGLVLYTDFGYSFDSNEFSRSTTEGRPGFLTRKYSAPEVLNHEERNSKSDVYSLGCVFIDLLLALTLTQDPDNETSCYSESMAGIQERFKTLDISSRYSLLLEIINRMTDVISAQRLSAADVAIKTFATSGLSCNDCAANFTRKARHEPALSDKIAEYTQTVTLKQKQNVEEHAPGDRGNQTASEHPQFPPQELSESGEAIRSDQDSWWYESDELVNGKTDPREDGACYQDRDLPSDESRELKHLDYFYDRATPTQEKWPRQPVHRGTTATSRIEESKHMLETAASRIEEWQKIRGEQELHNDYSYNPKREAWEQFKRDIYSPVTSSASRPIDHNTPLMKPLSEATHWEWSDAHQDHYWWRCDEKGVLHYNWAKQYMVHKTGVLLQYATSNPGPNHDYLIDHSTNPHSIVPLRHDFPNPRQSSSMFSSRPNNYETQPQADSRERPAMSLKAYMLIIIGLPERKISEVLNIFQPGRLFFDPYFLHNDFYQNLMSVDAGNRMEQVGKPVNPGSLLYVVVRVDIEHELVHACPVLSHEDRQRMGLKVSTPEHVVIYYSGETPIYWETEWGLERNAIEFERIDSTPPVSMWASSAIWFGGMYTFSWSVEARHIGSVTPADKPKFIEYLFKEGLWYTHS